MLTSYSSPDRPQK